MPLWVWNDELQWSRLKEQLAQFKNLGFGGVFVHPRPGLITEYLGREWFEMWKKSMLYCKKLGMECNIYDENSYPSGFAGGHVPSIAPETTCQYVKMTIGSPAHPVPPNNLAAFEISKKNGKITSLKDVTAHPMENRGTGKKLMVFELRRASSSPWTGDFPYVDLTNPQTVKAFIETTHRRYYEQFGTEFGKTIQSSFIDEPLLATDLVYAAGTQPMLPLSFYTLSEFQRRKGYDLRKELPSLFVDVGDYRKVRFDYWETLHDLWKENFLSPLGNWCEKHRIALTGHYMEHEWPAPFITPDDMSLYASMQMPGIDLLLTTLLKPDRRYAGYPLINDDTHMLLTMRMLLSAVNQLGKTRALAELWGAGGWDSTIEDYKRMGDWALAHGINFFNPHLSYVTVRGARKRDHPQSFSDHAGWWKDIKGLNDRIGRLSYALSQGRMKNRVLVLQPTTSAFLFAKPDKAAEAEFARMRREHGSLIQSLCDYQIDFDLGDEYLLEEVGSAGKGKLHVGRSTYHLVVLPPSMTNMRHQTLSLLEKYLRGGGKVLALASAPTYVDGQKSDFVLKLSRRFRKQWRRIKTTRELIRTVKAILRPYISFSSSPPKNFSHHIRHLGDGSSFHFFFNGGTKPFRSVARLNGKSLEVWDVDSGEIRPGEFRPRGADELLLPIHLQPTQSVLLRVLPNGKNNVPPVKQLTSGRQHSHPIRSLTVTPESLNVLVLDYCDVRYLGKEEKGVNTWRANWNVWQAHGFERPAWDNAVQFKRRVLDQNTFSRDSGFEVVFHFDVRKGVDLASLELAIECPELYEVSLNGKRINFKNAKRWMDPHILGASIANAVRSGRNEVQISGRPFDVRMELENIYIQGRFSLHPTSSGFRIAPERKLNIGPWSNQGFPFFSESVHYDAVVKISKAKGRIYLQLPSWKGGSASVQVDGKRIGLIAWKPYELDLTDSLTAGDHRIRVTINGTPKNLFGPFHDPARSRNTAWPTMWSRFPEHRPPPGEKYDTEDYGIFKAVRLLITEV
jgi:hypothetical protein